MVGPNGLEPSTSSVSGRRSNQLSYGPTCKQYNSTGGWQFQQRVNDVGEITGRSRAGEFLWFSNAATTIYNFISEHWNQKSQVHSAAINLVAMRAPAEDQR